MCQNELHHKQFIYVFVCIVYNFQSMIENDASFKNAWKYKKKQEQQQNEIKNIFIVLF